MIADSAAPLSGQGFPVSGLRFDPELVVRGLIIDTQLGHILKVDRCAALLLRNEVCTRPKRFFRR